MPQSGAFHITLDDFCESKAWFSPAFSRQNFIIETFDAGSPEAYDGGTNCGLSVLAASQTPPFTLISTIFPQRTGVEGATMWSVFIRLTCRNFGSSRRH